MKATINGITVEGTPQEIMEYQRLKAQEVNKNPFAEVCRDIKRSTDIIRSSISKVDSMTEQIKRLNMKRSVS